MPQKLILALQQSNTTSNTHPCTYYYIRLTAFFQENLVIRHQKGKPFWILLESKRWWGGSGISWTICKSFAPRSRQRTMPVPHHSFFTGWMPFLPPNQQCQSIEGMQNINKTEIQLESIKLPLLGSAAVSPVVNFLRWCSTGVVEQDLHRHKSRGWGLGGHDLPRIYGRGLQWCSSPRIQHT